VPGGELGESIFIIFNVFDYEGLIREALSWVGMPDIGVSVVSVAFFP
jgi:hypothetical protein